MIGSVPSVPSVAPYGTWPSPLSVGDVAAGRISRSALRSDGQFLYWLENRPEAGERTALVRGGGGEPARVVSPEGVGIRSRVHEYGGGAYCLVPGRADTRLAYVEEVSQRVMLVGPGEPVALTPEPPAGERWHHGDLVATGDGRWILAVRERIEPAGAVTHSIVWIDPAVPGQSGTLCSGRGFYMTPRPDARVRALAWISWDHPDMSWYSSELWVGTLHATGAGLEILSQGLVDGGPGVSVTQPLWMNERDLLYLSDRGGYWQPWRWSGGEPEQLSGEESDFCEPDWQLGQSALAVLDDDHLGCTWRRDGLSGVGLMSLESGGVDVVPQPCVAVAGVCSHDGGVAWLGATPVSGTGVWWAAPGRDAEVVEPAPPSPIAPQDVSVAESLSFTAPSGRTVRLLFYSPQLRDVVAPDATAPPLVVFCHGGPTAAAGAGLDLFVQLLTTRGYAVAAVNYAGSAGEGRALRVALDGAWGEADVDDCVDAARWLAESGRTAAASMAIRGTSSGGLTALGALIRARVFAAAVTWYGVTDLLSLAAATHDFEFHYIDRLVGPLPAARERYRERSPVNRVGDLEGAVLLLQGLDDRVVPPAQAESMVTALHARGVRCEYLAFEGEGHGFRRLETLQAAYQAELDFYAEILT
jgi:dipeptidyl aminopeptidase/acylaminoacyl peptidase